MSEKELYCSNCPEIQKTRCNQRKEEFRKGYKWLEDYIKNNLKNGYEGFGQKILEQVNALKIYPARCDYVLEQQLQASNKRADKVEKELKREIEIREDSFNYGQNLSEQLGQANEKIKELKLKLLGKTEYHCQCCGGIIEDKEALIAANEKIEKVKNNIKKVIDILKPKNGQELHTIYTFSYEKLQQILEELASNE